uniref:Uncharacterized protein n=1 Tax=viral metagenome TaxID=1070528 RepID=A0A6C0HNE0_9ZZZZ
MSNTNRNKNKNGKKTLKKVITNYLLKKGDVCCEKDMDRKLIIQDILATYQEIADFMFEKELYLGYVQNDLLVFIGYRVDLEKGNQEGVRIWDGLARMTETNKNPDKQKLVKILHNVPLYYLLAFLGYATYKNRRNQAISALNQK